jgi:hypothetical protein
MNVGRSSPGFREMIILSCKKGLPDFNKCPYLLSLSFLIDSEPLLLRLLLMTKGIPIRTLNKTKRSKRITKMPLFFFA